MSINLAVLVARPSRGRFVFCSTLIVVAVVAFFLIPHSALKAVPDRPRKVQEFRRAPRFSGKSIPDPPHQGQPWTPPATRLPKFLITATAILFDQGVADPRGCEYRDVEISLGSIMSARGFVLPARNDVTGRPKLLENGFFEALGPLLDHPDRPAMTSAARWLFNDPKSPWVPLLYEARGKPRPFYPNLFDSPLIAVAGFQEAVIRGLADKAPLGTVERLADQSTRFRFKGSNENSYSSVNVDFDGAVLGVVVPVRSCDYLAAAVSELEGCPRLSLFWPEARRDEDITAIVAHLKRFDNRYTWRVGQGVNHFPSPKAHVKFPILGRPATLADVASDRAILSLEGKGETRLVRLPGFPQSARWSALIPTPPGPPDRDADAHRYHDTLGFVWQAEEVCKGDGWERVYGFVGHNVIGRAPASEIEFPNATGDWSGLYGGLDARAERVANGKGLVKIAVHVRNQLGLPRICPTEFLQVAADGKPALRNGISLSLWRPSTRPPRAMGSAQRPEEPIEPKRVATFTPGDGSRSLETLEAFEATQIDLNDWFDLAHPGKYRLMVRFSAESGLGEGAVRGLEFRGGGGE